ncbi:UDP-3-O-acylglucosamine N-acyltransferase [Maridesulfovibrio hydrothermalis]|uniref:Putative UDP-3-O-acylglucosamine N-acyltransferase n=1 Tax=Maridesulfovibrio hydrothermalis AM13 = DSM 14728 TaxID=1121451 RepID=L0R8W8_9BACT|nr:UDP-3-O-acylglucosamine N-acyltransferase [Maridesulfovibrio hydrothermalis]CCO23208.1 putative UDP-3-O-acylglucosamine N-acyltransferase [Maridesulfovibrio hydrothermalis AM13 = DSM 14728]
MLISKIGKEFGFDVVNDQKIDNLKLLFQNKTNSLVFINNCNLLRSVLDNTNIKVIIAPPDCTRPATKKVELIKAKDPKTKFFEIHDFLLKKTNFYFKKTKSNISEKATVSERAAISPFNVTIEGGAVIEDFVTIEANVHIKADSHIKSGAYIGGDGLFVIDYNGTKKIVPHGGSVFISEGAVIGPNTVIDKGLFKDTTFVGKNTVIDSLVRIAHNSSIGDNCVIAGNTSISGSTIIHDNVYIEPNATIGAKIVIGNHAQVGTGTVVIEDIPEGRHVIGRSVGHIPVIK